MKIPDLSKIDIKDIDINKVRREILDHKEIAIQVILVVVSLFVLVSIFNSSQAAIKKYKAQISTLLAKTGLIEEYKKVDKEIKDFLSKVPEPVSEDKMVNLITDMAGKNKVRIMTFSQAKVDTKDTVQTTSMTFTLAADSFVNMVKFLVDIEKGKDFLKILRCPVTPRSDETKASENGKTVPINFRVDVVSVKVNP